MRNGIPAPGFSDRADDPEILNALQKNKKAAGIFGVILIPLPLIGFLIYSKVTGNMPAAQAFKTGAIVSAVFLVFTLISKISSALKKPYEAVVTDKRTRTRTHNGDENLRGIISMSATASNFIRSLRFRMSGLINPQHPVFIARSARSRIPLRPTDAANAAFPC